MNAYDEGYTAANGGASLKSNPYFVGNSDHDDWDAGWNDGDEITAARNKISTENRGSSATIVTELLTCPVNDQKKIVGQLKIAVEVECPGCCATIDLFEIKKLTDYDFLKKSVLSEDAFGCADLGEEIECPDRGKTLVVGQIRW